MAIDLYLAPDPGQVAFGVDQEGRPLDPPELLAIHVLFFPNTVGLADVVVFVRQKRDAQFLLGAEFGVRVETVFRQAEHMRPGGVELGPCGGKADGFLGAARRVVARIEEQHHRRALQRRQGDRVTIVARQGEIGGRRIYVHHVMRSLGRDGLVYMLGTSQEQQAQKRRRQRPVRQSFRYEPAPSPCTAAHRALGALVCGADGDDHRRVPVGTGWPAC